MVKVAVEQCQQQYDKLAPAIDSEQPLSTAQTTELKLVCKQQHAMIKKLALEIDIEHGRNKILKHESERMRK